MVADKLSGDQDTLIKQSQIGCYVGICGLLNIVDRLIITGFLLTHPILWTIFSAILLLAAGKISFSCELSDFRDKYDMCKRYCFMAYGCSEVATLNKVNKIAWKVTSEVTILGHLLAMWWETIFWLYS